MALDRASRESADLSSLTGLRFFASASTFLGHFQENGRFPIPGFGDIVVLGMPLFFILSGFVIHYRYGRELALSADRIAAVSDFFGARFARLAPLYVFFFFIYLYMQGWALPFFQGGHLFDFVAMNLTPMFSWLPVWYHHDLQLQTFFGVSWSISTEVFFYLCYPLYGALLWRAKVLKSLAVLVPLFCLLVIAWLWLLYRTNSQWQHWASATFLGSPSTVDDVDNSFYRWLAYVSPYTRMLEFILGALTAQVYLVLQSRPASRAEQQAGGWLSAGGLGGMVMLYCVQKAALNALARCGGAPACHWSLSPFVNAGFVYFLNVNFLFAVPIAVFIFCAGRYSNALASRALAAGVVVYLGEISYSLYLSHPFVSQMTDQWLQPFVVPWYRYASVPLKIVLTIGFAAITYALVERP
jgi:peptidoglycan/LPS O-acetylase OafA/YrhL